MIIKIYDQFIAILMPKYYTSLNSGKIALCNLELLALSLSAKKKKKLIQLFFPEHT